MAEEVEEHEMSYEEPLPLDQVISAIEEERAHYGYIILVLKDLESVTPTIAAFDKYREKLQDLRERIEGWDRAARAIEVQLTTPDS